MPKSSQAAERAAQAGFTLIEALVALAVAAVALPAISSSFGMAWSRARIAEETVAELTLARYLAAEVLARPRSPPRPEKAQGFEFSIAAEPLRMEGLVPALSPPLPEAIAKPAPGRKAGEFRRGDMKRIVVTVIAPSGRRLQLETVQQNTAPPQAAAH